MKKLLITGIFLLISIELVRVIQHIYPKQTETKEEFTLPEGWIFKQVDHYCDSFNINSKFIYDLGMNESKWKNPNDSTFIMPPLYVSGPNEDSYGDLQMIGITWRHWSKRLGLKEKTRKNLLIACIAYAEYQVSRYNGDYRKARFAYARGSWRPEKTWKRIERRFMKKYDNNNE